MAFRFSKVKVGDSSSSSMNAYNQKRSIDQVGSAERHNQIKHKRIDEKSDSDINDSIENMTSDDIFLPAMHPHVTINESPRYDTSSVKRESNDLAISQPHSPNSFKGSYRMLVYKISLKLRLTFCIYLETPNAPVPSSSYPYNYQDYSHSDVSSQNDNKSLLHMDIPAGENFIEIFHFVCCATFLRRKGFERLSCRKNYCFDIYASAYQRFLTKIPDSFFAV